MPLKIAIAGTGPVARENYIPFLKTQSDVELAYFNRTHDTALAVASKHGGTAMRTIQELTAWRPDAVLLLVAETARYTLGNELIESGVPKIFFEKPLVAMKGQAHIAEDDFFKARTMLELAAAQHCETAMVFNYRFFEPVQILKRIAAERNFGQVVNATALVHYACWSHCIDLLHFFIGSAREITALAGDLEHAAPVVKMRAADVVAALKFENGATGTITGTAALAWQHPLFEITLTFERARCHLRDLGGPLEILATTSQNTELITPIRNSSRWDHYADSFKRSLAAYLDSLRNHQPPPIPGIDGLKELQFEAALKRSIAAKRPVILQDEFPLQAAVSPEKSVSLVPLPPKPPPKNSALIASPSPPSSPTYQKSRKKKPSASTPDRA